jgi:hypothetical protein
MHTAQSAGRIYGAVLLSCFVLGIWNNFGLVGPIFQAEGGYLSHAAEQTTRFGSSVLLALLTSLLGLWAAAWSWRWFKPGAPVLALCGLLLAASSLATTIAEQVNFLSMHALSEQYLRPGADATAPFEVFRALVSAQRNSIHFLDKILGGIGVLLIFAVLWRNRQISMVFATLGMLGALCQITGISLGLFGRGVPMWMLAPLALSYLALALTLLARGFIPQRAQPES